MRSIEVNTNKEGLLYFQVPPERMGFVKKLLAEKEIHRYEVEKAPDFHTVHFQERLDLMKVNEVVNCL